jgi:hypothetical protein
MNDQNEDDFVRVAETKDIQTSQMKELQIDGEDVCIANVEGKYYADSSSDGISPFCICSTSMCLCISPKLSNFIPHDLHV